MARPKVPHCRDCRYLFDVNAIGSFRNSYGSWHCNHPDVLEGLFGRAVNGQEVRTSPLWCPFRCRRR